MILAKLITKLVHLRERFRRNLAILVGDAYKRERNRRVENFIQLAESFGGRPYRIVQHPRIEPPTIDAECRVEDA